MEYVQIPPLLILGGAGVVKISGRKNHTEVTAIF
jgi:hypothetical protein